LSGCWPLAIDRNRASATLAPQGFTGAQAFGILKLARAATLGMALKIFLGQMALSPRVLKFTYAAVAQQARALEDHLGRPLVQRE